MVAVVTGSGLGLERGSGLVLGSRGQLGDAGVGRFGETATVNAATGNLVLNRSDEILIGLGPDSAIVRSYNSLGLMNDDNGDNWRLNAQRRVTGLTGTVNTAGSTVTRIDWDGSDTVYTWDASVSAYVSKAGSGAYDRLTYTANVWTWTDGNSRVVETYDNLNSGRILTSADTDGNQLSFAYTSGNLTRVTTADGEFTDLSWNGNLLTQLTTKTAGGTILASRVRYGYDGSNRLSSVTVDMSPGDNSISDGKTVTTTYTYDGSSKRVASISESGSSSFVSFTYDSNNRIASVTEASSDGSRTTGFSYDTANRRTTVTDGLAKATVLAYDASGNLASVTYPADGAGNPSQVVQYAYNANGDVTSVTDAMGKVVTYSYDGNGNLLSQQDAAGNLTRYEYGAANQLLKTIVVPKLGDALPGTGVDAAYYRATYPDIAAAGDTVDPLLHYSSFWNQGRNPNALFDTNYYLAQNPDIAAAGLNPLQHYLANGWAESSRAPASGVTTAEYIARYVNETTRYVYDTENHLRFVITPEGKVTEYRYNSAGNRISAITYSDNSYMVGSLASTANLTEANMAAWIAGLGTTAKVQRTDTTYDYRGNVSSETAYSDLYVNRLRFSRFEQGTNGWWTWQSQPNMLQGSAVTATNAGTGKKYIQQTFRSSSSNDWVAIYSGNDSGNKVTPGERLAVSAGIGSSTGVATLIVRVQYFDSNGAWLSDSPDVASKSGAQAFDTRISGFVDVPAGAAQARLVLYANASTLNTNLTFSLTEPSISQATPDQAAVPGFAAGIAALDTATGAAGSASYTRTSYIYDQFGLLLSRNVSGWVGAEVFTYDGLGRTLTATDLTGAVTTTAFNDAARTTTVTLANGMVKTSTYTAQGELWTYTESGSGLASETENYKYDKLGRLRITSDAIGARDFTFYDDAGRLVGQMDRQGYLTEYRFDAANRLIATIHYANQLSIGAILSLYDANGNPAAAAIASVRPAANVGYDRWEWLVYDNADRVTQKIETIDGAWQNPYGKVTAYEYDGAGHVASTRDYATKLSQEVVAAYKVNPPGGANRVFNADFESVNNAAPSGTDGWAVWESASGLIASSVPSSGSQNGKHYIRGDFTATAANQTVALHPTARVNITPGERLAITAGVGATGAVSQVAVFVDFWDRYGNYMSNLAVGALAGQQSFDTKIGGFVTAPQGAASARIVYYAWTSGAGAGSFSLVEPTITSATATQTALPAFDATPPASAQDRIGRSFYSDDGQLIGTVDGGGAVKQFVYDQAGRLYKTIAHANFAAVNLRGAANFETLLANVGISLADRTEYLVYNGQGQIRYRLDGNLRPTEYIYDGAGRVIRTIDYGASIAPSASFSASYVQGQIASLGLSTHAETRITRAVYDGADRHVFDIDALGYVTTYVYDSATRLVVRTSKSVTAYTGTGDPDAASMWAWAGTPANQTVNDRHVRTIYDRLGRLVYEVDAEGFITEHQYDLNDRVIKDIRYSSRYSVADGATVASVAGQIGTLPADAVVTTYAYDLNGNVIDTWDGQGNRTHYDRNAFGEAWQITEAYGTADEAKSGYIFDTSGRMLNALTAVDMPAPTTVGYGYDAVGNLTSSSDANHSTTTYTYDAIGNRLTETVPLALDGSTFATTAYQYDAFGNVVKTIDPRGNASYSYYDKLDRLVLSIDQEGYATQNTYTTGNQIATTTRYYTQVSDSYNVNTQPQPTGNTADATTRFAYDKLGRLTKATDAQDYYEQYTLDAFGNRVAVRNKLNGTTVNQFDKRGLLVKETLPVGSTLSDGTPQTGNIVNTFEYDARGNRIKMIEAFGFTEQRTTTYEYDKNNRLTSKTGDQQLVTHYNGAGAYAWPVERYQYDGRGNLILSTDAAGAKTFAYFDDNDRKIAEVNAVGKLTYWTYDANGNVISTKVFDSAVTLPAVAGGTPPSAGTSTFRETVFGYDKANRLVTTSVSGVRFGWPDAPYTTVPTGTATSTNYYDAAGNIIKQTDANTASLYTYYDKLGRRIAQIDQNKYLTTWTLDEDGNVTKETRYANAYVGTPPTGGTPPSVTADAKDRTTTFTYDLNGRRLKEQRLNVAYSGISSTGSRGDESGTAEIVYTYNELGEVLSKTEATGDKTEYAYDKMGRQASVTGPAFKAYDNPNVDVRNTIVNSYDGLNNLTRSVQNGERVSTFIYVKGQLTATFDANGAWQGYYYDEAGRLTFNMYYGLTNGVWRTEARSMAYDLVGNVTAQTTYYLNAAGNAWIQEGDITKLAYNVHGEVKAKGLRGGDAGVDVWPETMDYDAAGRIWRSTAGDGTVKLYIYDGGGRASLVISSSGTPLASGGTLASLTLDQAVALLTNNGAVAIGSVDIAGMVVTINVYDARGQLVSVREPRREFASGTQVDTLVHNKAYNAFGEVVSETDARGNTTTYTYNTMGRLASKQLPLVSVTAENGAKSDVNPTEKYYYDKSGRLIATVDANGNGNTRTLLAGTGYGGEEAKVLKEFHPDGGVLENRYDVFGDLRVTINEVNAAQALYYDKLGRLIQLNHATRADGSLLIDSYVYDSRGQRISHTALNAPSAGEATRGMLVYRMYDAALGRVPDPGGYETYTNKLLAGVSLDQLYIEICSSPEYQNRTNSSGKTVANMTNSEYVEFVYNSVFRRSSEPGGNDYYTGLLNTRYWSRPELLRYFSDHDQHISYMASIGRTLPWQSLIDTTEYDIQGRITKVIAPGGDTTTYSYGWNTGITAIGLSGSSSGGWQKITTNSAGLTQYENTDYFGRMVWRRDYGGRDYGYTFDLAGRLVQQTNTEGQSITNSYYNTGLLKQVVSNYAQTDYGSTITSTYKYDKQGNRTFEGYVAAGTKTEEYAYEGTPFKITTPYSITHQQATVTWDAANRMTSFSDNAASGSPVTIDWEYDSRGNIRRMKAAYRQLDAQGQLVATTSTQDYWYKYDSLNRFVMTKGMLIATDANGLITATGDAARSLANARIDRYTEGSDIGYDAAGRRTYAVKTKTVSATYQAQKEIYRYSEDGYLNEVAVALGGQSYNLGYVPPPAATDAGTVRATYARDGLGRVTDYTEYAYDEQAGTTHFAYSKDSTYNAKNQVSFDVVTSARSDGTWVNSTTYSFNDVSTGAYQGGAVTKADTSITKNGVAQTGGITTNKYKWWDGALQNETTYVSGSTNNTSTFYYDDGGRLQSVYIQDGRPRTVSFITDSYGQVLRRDERGGQPGGDPHELHYYFNGVQVGDVSNNGTSDVDYVASIAGHQATSGTGAFRNGASGGSAYADFDQSYAPINGYNYESTASRYTVQAGDTLDGIARKLWGDAGFWYLIAEANGLSGTENLAPGQSLIIPNKVHNSHNTSDVFRVYDPNEAIGDTSPTAATPPPAAKGKKCGAFGAILLAVVAMAVAIVLPEIGFATPSAFGGGVAGTVISGAVTGAIGSAVSQGVGLATGLQDKFSFKQVALAGLAGGVGGYFRGLSAAAEGGAKLGNVASFLSRGGVTSAVARGLVSNLVTQGIGVATGLQDRFDWGGLAAAGIMGGVGEWAGGTKFAKSLGKTGGRIVSGMAGGIAGAAAQSLVTGQDFGDTLMSNLPSVIGNTLGNWIVDEIAGVGSGTRGAGDGSSDQSTVGESATTTGAGDGTKAQPVAGRVGNGGSDAKFTGITVTASRTFRDLYWSMNNSQYSWYFGQAGQANNESLAHMALSLKDSASPVVTGSFRPSPSYDSPLVQSLKTIGFYSLYSDGPAPQYMLRDGSVFTGTLAGLNQYKDLRAGQANMAYVERLRASTAGGIALGVAHEMGASPAAQDLLYGLASTVDVLAYGSALRSGGRVTLPVSGRPSITSVWSGAAKEVAPEGIVYLRTDISGKIAPYGGQAMNDARYLARQAEHARDFPNAKFEFEIIDRANPGRALDIAEHNFIQELTGGVAARRSSAVSNMRDPVGAARRPAFGLPEPR